MNKILIGAILLAGCGQSEYVDRLDMCSDMAKDLASLEDEILSGEYSADISTIEGAGALLRDYEKEYSEKCNKDALDDLEYGKYRIKND